VVGLLALNKPRDLDAVSESETPTAEVMPLGRTKDVMIRAMPEGLWNLIVRAARRGEMTTAEFLCAHFERHGVAADMPLNAIKPVMTITDNRSALNTPNAAAIQDLVQAAATLKEIGGLEASTMAALNAQIRRLSKPAKQLTAPSQGTEQHRA
jgi:hypothetical protein